MTEVLEKLEQLKELVYRPLLRKLTIFTSTTSHATSDVYLEGRDIVFEGLGKSTVVVSERD